MQLAVSTYSLSRWRTANRKSLEQSLEQIARLDVKAVEFSGIDATQGDNQIRRAASLRRPCEKLGLRVVGYCIGAELLFPAKKQRAVIDRLKLQADVAAELGTSKLRHDITGGFNAYPGYRGPKTFAAALKIVVPAIREVADYASTQGIGTSLENHGFFMQASKRVERLIRMVNHSSFGLTMDMGNFLCVNEEPVQAVRRLDSYAVRLWVTGRLTFPPNYAF